MGVVYVSPTEHDPFIKGLGKANSIPEEYGCDVWWVDERGQMGGVQRKEVKDLVASMNDGRLGKETLMMEPLTYKMLVVEGKMRWTRDGELVDGWAKVTRQQLRAFLWTVRSRGVWVEWTDDTKDTAQVVRWFQSWCAKEKHNSLTSRPGPRGDMWGRVTSKDYAKHLLTSLPGVGPGLAERILSHFGGVPLRWDTDVIGLMEVDGIGKKKAEMLMKVLEGGEL